MTKQVEYRGELVRLTEALSHLPTGGQVLLSDPTFRLVAHRLHNLRLPAVSALTTELSARSNRLKLVRYQHRQPVCLMSQLHSLTPSAKSSRPKAGQVPLGCAAALYCTHVLAQHNLSFALRALVPCLCLKFSPAMQYCFSIWTCPAGRHRLQV